MSVTDAGRREIRVVIVNMPPLLAAVVRQTVEAEQDMLIVAEVDSSAEGAAAVAKGVDVIVTAAASGDLPRPAREHFFGSAAIPVVAISVDGTSSDVYRRSVTRGHGMRGLGRLMS